jgi:CRISPR-associated protein Cmr6
MAIYCPFDTQEIVNPNRIDNFALRFRHFLENEPGNDGKVKFKISATNLGGSQQALEHLRARQIDGLRRLATHNHVFCGVSQVDWRLIIGIGGEHVQETGMTLDHIYGIPVIPESAIKGVVRSWIIGELFGGDEELAMREIRDDDSDELKQNKGDFLDVFGSQEQAGKVQFLTAYPNGNSVAFATDIMNPHFPRYYAGSSPPTDDQDPIPVNFLTVTDTEYRFVFVTKVERLVELVSGWLGDAIQNKGLGAKSAVGYGYFRRLARPPRRLVQLIATPPPVQRPQREPKPRPLSLDDAHKIYVNQPADRAQIQLDIEPIKAYAAKFAIVATRDDFVELSELEGVHATLIVSEEGYAMISDFGAWVWERVKDELLTSRILELPRLTYSTTFRRALIRLNVETRVRLQEHLIEISNQLENSDGDTEQIALDERIRYTADPKRGTFTLVQYTI